MRYCGVYITQVKSKEATRLSFHGLHTAKVAKRSHCTEKTENADLAWGEGWKGEELNLKRNSGLHSCHFNKEQISTDGYMGGDPVPFFRNNWTKLTTKVQDECKCCPLSPGITCSLTMRLCLFVDTSCCIVSISCFCTMSKIQPYTRRETEEDILLLLSEKKQHQPHFRCYDRS